MNRTSRDQPDADVRGRSEYTQGGGSRANAAGGGLKSPARSVASIRASPTNLKRGGSARGLEHWRVLYLDGVHFSIRHGEKADATIILTALGVDQAGNKEALARRSCAEESKEGGLGLLQDLRMRGATQIDLIVTDGHEGLLGAVSELFTATPRQRCLVHKQRNVLAAIPRRERSEVQGELAGIWEQATKPEALSQLAAFKAKYAVRYPEGHHTDFCVTVHCRKA